MCVCVGGGGGGVGPLAVYDYQKCYNTFLLQRCFVLFLKCTYVFNLLVQKENQNTTIQSCMFFLKS